MSIDVLVRIRNRFLLSTLVFFAILMFVIYSFYSWKTVLDIGVGFLVGFIDSILLFWGISKGSKHTDIFSAMSTMQKNMLHRIIFLLVTCLLLNKLIGINVFWVFATFLFLHFLFIIFLVVNTWFSYDET